MEPPKVIVDLIDANKKWAAGMPSGFFTGLLNPQKPQVLWIGCSDSRVPASVVTSSLPGEIFTHTNIANQFHNSDDNAHSVLSYAVNTVGVKHVVLVGHSDCGGVKEAITTADKEEHVDTPLTRWLKPLVDLVKGLELKDPAFKGLTEKEKVDRVVRENIMKQVNNIRTSEPIMAAQATENKVSVHALIYDLSSGLIKEVTE